MATHSTLTEGAWIEETGLSRCARCWFLLHCMSPEVAQSRHAARARECPLLGDKQTSQI
jgi:hypothetical protein